MRKPIVSLITIAFLMLGIAKAQVPSLGFRNVSFLNTTVEINDTIFFQAWLYNYGNVTFQDPLTFRLLNNGVPVMDPDIWPSPYPPGPPPIETINPGDSILLHFRIITETPVFAIGPTGVVIWPKALNDSIIVHDSIQQQIEIVDVGMDINDNETIKSLLWQQANGNLLISGCNDCTPAISLYDVTGKLLFTSKQTLPVQVPLSNLPAGVLFVNVDFGNGIYTTRKIIVK